MGQDRHTVKRWEVSERKDRIRVVAYHDSGYVILFDEPLTAETEATAHLIAAAPSMRKALVEAAIILREHMPYTALDWLVAAEAALAQARGDEPKS